MDPEPIHLTALSNPVGRKDTSSRAIITSKEMKHLLFQHSAKGLRKKKRKYTCKKRKCRHNKSSRKRT